ncbi:11803_t:CDS:1, partial [Rhizophagus irregularis]
AEPETVYRSGYFKRDASRSYSYKRDADAEPFGAFKRDAGAEPEAWGRW